MLSSKQNSDRTPKAQKGESMPQAPVEPEPRGKARTDKPKARTCNDQGGPYWGEDLSMPSAGAI